VKIATVATGEGSGSSDPSSTQLHDCTYNVDECRGVMLANALMLAESSVVVALSCKAMCNALHLRVFGQKTSCISEQL
jgi:hypothetical protein